MEIIKKIFITTVIFSLVACAGATRIEPEKFKLLSSGQIKPQDVPRFVDCLNDGFNRSHWGITNYEVRQTQRADGYRVETYTGSLNYLIVSADVFHNGKVNLLESEDAVFINTTGEREAFSHCLKQF